MPAYGSITQDQLNDVMNRWNKQIGNPAAPNPSYGNPSPGTSPGTVNWNDPNSIALLLGTSGNTPGYNTNDSGSFERNYNQVLNSLNPNQLIQRYSNPKANANMFQTPLDQANYQAYQSFQSMFGRAPSQNEFAQVQAAFQGPNGAINGRAYLANLQQQYQSNPQNPNSPWNPNNQNNQLGQYSDQVKQMFQSTLGRDPNPMEMSSYAGSLGSNQMNPLQLQQMLQQMPEYQNKIDTQFRGQLGGQLTDINSQFFSRAKDQVLSQLSQNGIQNSTAMDSAITDLMKQMGTQQSGFLANLSSQQYGGNKNLAAQDYSSSLGQLYGNINYNRGNQQNYGQQLLGQGFAGADYYRQQQDYMNAINQMRPNPNQGNFFNYLNAGLGVANTGANLFRAFGGGGVPGGGGGGAYVPGNAAFS